MIVAAIETSGAVGSVAVARDEAPLREAVFAKGVRHGREVVPRLRDLLRDLGLEASSVDLFAVGSGPGSYTGLRVGIMTAKTLAWSLGRPLVAVPSFDALALSVGPAEAGDARTLLVATDARRDRIYRGAYALEPGGQAARPRRLGELEVVAPGEALAGLEPPVLVLGDAPALYPEAFAGAGAVRLGLAGASVPRASAVARLAFEAYRAGARPSVHEAAPLYLRPSLPEEKRGG